MCRWALVISLVCSAAVPASAIPWGQPAPAKTDDKPAARKSSKKAKAKSKSKKRRRGEHDRSRYESVADFTTTPAYRYGMMSAAECTAELDTRKIPYTKEPATKGVLAPVRLTGTLHGVEYRTNQRDSVRATTAWEVADCRLVLALDDFAVILQAHGIVDVRHYSMYRSPGKQWPADKVGMRHNGALAIDLARLIAKDGSFLDVDDHFNGRIGAKTCVEGSGPHPVTAKATELRAILCEAVDKRIFNFHLTPNYNRAHKNHFHLEVTAGFKAFMAH